MILGSGFQHVTRQMQIDAVVPYRELPGFPAPTVPGHAGQMFIGRLGNTAVMLLSGRAHYYEGHSMAEITFPVRALASSGIRDLLLTNAAGGLNSSFRVGEFMMLTDHINMMGANPLRASGAGAPAFVDLSRVYDLDLRRLLQRAARAARVKLRAGVYLAVSGPSYETPAEIRAFGRLGADAVGMSTVPEAIVARHCGLRVAALSCITNLAAGSGQAEISHSEVLKTGARVQTLAAQLLKNFTNFYASIQ
jgi:inosine/guanosine/xanthosine phosphorylase family protein